MSETEKKERATEKATTPVKEEVKFTKDSIVRSEKYKNRADILNVLLEEDKEYTLETVDNLIKNFMKGKVN